MSPTPLDALMIDVLAAAQAMLDDLLAPFASSPVTLENTLPLFGVPKELVGRFAHDPTSASIATRSRVATFLGMLSAITPEAGVMADRARSLVDRVRAAHTAEAQLQFAHVTPDDERERAIAERLANVFAASPPPALPSGFTWDEGGLTQ